MRCALLRMLLTALLVLTSMRLAEAEPSPPPQLQEEVWGLPFELPTLAYVVHPAGNGPFPLVVMNHGVSLDAKQRSFFPLVEFRDAAFWFARQGYMVVAPVGPGYGGGGFDVPERGQITEAFPWNEAPRYMVRDHDRIYGTVVTCRCAPWASGTSLLHGPHPGRTALLNG